MENESTTVDKSSSNKKWNRRAIIVSIIVNALIIIALGFWYISFTQKSDYKPTSPVAESQSKPLPPVEPQVEPKPGEKAKDTVNRVLEEQTQAAAQRTDEENMAVLKQQGERLKQVSSEETIDQIADQFHGWAGTENRVTEPVADVSTQTEQSIDNTNFDTQTAQFHDVKKLKSKSTGQVKYKAILIDAQGRTMSLELPKEDGEKLYPLFKEMKKNPLMAQIYKKIVMPLLDKSLQGIKEQGIENPSTPAPVEENKK